MIVTLDSLCAKAGIPPFPLLEEMPPELEVDAQDEPSTEEE